MEPMDWTAFLQLVILMPYVCILVCVVISVLTGRE